MGSKRNQNRATLQSVATLAGVSVTTASLVLSGKHELRRISDSAHDRVMQAAAELNYAPNLLVRSLRKGRSHILAFYNGFRNRESSDIYMDKLATSVEFAGGLYGYLHWKPSIRPGVNWCERRDSNSHGCPHRNLNPARLPIPPLSPRQPGRKRRALYRY